MRQQCRHHRSTDICSMCFSSSLRRVGSPQASPSPPLIVAGAGASPQPTSAVSLRYRPGSDVALMRMIRCGSSPRARCHTFRQKPRAISGFRHTRSDSCHTRGERCHTRHQTRHAATGSDPLEGGPTCHVCGMTCHKPATGASPGHVSISAPSVGIEWGRGCVQRRSRREPPQCTPTTFDGLAPATPLNVAQRHSANFTPYCRVTVWNE